MPHMRNHPCRSVLALVARAYRPYQRTDGQWFFAFDAPRCNTVRRSVGAVVGFAAVVVGKKAFSTQCDEKLTSQTSETSSVGRAARVRTVVVLVAMEQEAAPFIERHALQRITPSPFPAAAPMEAYSGDIGNNNDSVRVLVVWNGRDKRYKVNNVATVAGAVSAYASIVAFSPDLVISAGTAGGFQDLGAFVGAVYLSTKCVFHARRIPESDTGHFEEYGFGHYRSPILSELARQVGLKQGVVSTADTLDCTPMDRALMRSEGAVVKDMEAAAVAWVCQQFHVPFIALKSVTDIVDGGKATEDEFYTNLHAASLALQEKLTMVLELIGQRELAQWRGF